MGRKASQGRADLCAAGLAVEQVPDGRKGRGTVWRGGLPDVGKDRVESSRAVHAGGEVVVGQKRVGRLRADFHKRLDLVFQHFENEASILFGIVHMPGLKAAVMVVLDEVVIGVSRESDRIEPQCIDRRGKPCRQPWACGKEVFDVVFDDVVANDVRQFCRGFFQLIQLLTNVSACTHDGRRAAIGYCGEIEDFGGFRIDLKINRQTPFQQRSCVLGPSSYEVQKSHQIQGVADLAASLVALVQRGNRASSGSAARYAAGSTGDQDRRGPRDLSCNPFGCRKSGCRSE